MNIALIFAGGVGARMGKNIPKQFLEWNGKAILVHTLEQFEKNNRIDEIILVSKEEWIDYSRELIQDAGISKVKAVIAGGNTALDSQYNGLVKIKELHPDIKDIVVLIHDGVRPIVSKETIENVIDSVVSYGSGITVSKAIETVIEIDDNGEIKRIVNRDNCRMAKAPQGFYLDDILRVHEQTIKEGRHNYIDSASMMFDNGYTLHTVMGEAENIKITTPSDYYMYTGIIESRNKENGK